MLFLLQLKRKCGCILLIIIIITAWECIFVRSSSIVIYPPYVGSVRIRTYCAIFSCFLRVIFLGDRLEPFPRAVTNYCAHKKKKTGKQAFVCVQSRKGEQVGTDKIALGDIYFLDLIKEKLHHQQNNC